MSFHGLRAVAGHGSASPFNSEHEAPTDFLDATPLWSLTRLERTSAVL